MLSVLKFVVAILTLGPVISAVPTGQWTECQEGTSFFRCSNGYIGCFDYDPCSLPPKVVESTEYAKVAVYSTADLPTTTTTTSISNTVTTTASTSRTVAACPSGKLFRPTMWNVTPSQPDLAQSTVSHIRVQVNGSNTQLEQIVVFEGIPALAHSCNLMWAQAAPSERTFVVDRSGLVNSTQLTGFPVEGSPVSYNSMKPFEDYVGQKSNNFDFTFWDQPNQGATEHRGGINICAENMYFKVKLNTLNGDGAVFMEQDDKNGFFIEYAC